MIKKTIYLIIATMILFSGCSTAQNAQTQEEIQENIQNNTQENTLIQTQIQEQQEQNNQAEAPLKDQLMLMLFDDKDIQEYFQSYPDAKISSIETFYPESMMNQTRFIEIYQDLPEKELYKVEITTTKTELSIIGIVDLENKETLKVVGMYLIGISS